VFDDLSRSGELQIPKVLTGSGAMRDAVRLVSLTIAEPPGADDDAMYLLIKNGWRGNAETAAKFREVVDKDPNKSADWLYLGMSLYEIKDYRAAVGAFQKCAEHAAKNATLSEWAVVWEAQMHDLLGERENALRLYRSVAGSKNTATMMFGQYRIGPISAREWARQRIESPFTRR
jgi:tetratricopeptide (TPR) repeat protein